MFTKLKLQLIIMVMLTAYTPIVLSQTETVTEPVATPGTVEIAPAGSGSTPPFKDPCPQETVTQVFAPTAAVPNQELFKDLKFGVSVGVTWLGQPSTPGAVAETIIDAKGNEVNYVRVTEQQNFRREIWLETHYLLQRFCLWGQPAGHGPFIATSLYSEGGFLNAFGVGYMLALRRSSDPEDESSFNIGLGIQTTKVSVLGDGMVENQPLPAGVTDVRLKTVDSIGVMLIFSFTFF